VLCNRDKHRAILITTAYSKDATLVVHATDGSVHRVMSRELLRSDGPSIIPVPLPPRLMHPSVRIEARGRAVIAFRDTRGPWGDRTVGQVLLTCLTHLEERVIPRFRPFFVVENV
jgi:hypothetical protein